LVPWMGGEATRKIGEDVEGELLEKKVGPERVRVQQEVPKEGEKKGKKRTHQDIAWKGTFR